MRTNCFRSLPCVLSFRSGAVVAALLALGGGAPGSAQAQGVPKSWTFQTVGYERVKTLNSTIYAPTGASGDTVCVAYSHDAGLILIRTDNQPCNSTITNEFDDQTPGYERENHLNPYDPVQPALIRAPGVSQMLDNGEGVVFFAADGVEDLIIVDVNRPVDPPVYLHTGVEATSLALREKTLWIAGSRGATTLDVSKGTSDSSSLQRKLLKPPFATAPLGPWSVQLPKETQLLLVRDAVTQDYLTPVATPAALSFDEPQKPAPNKKRKPAPDKKEKATANSFSLNNPYTKAEPLSLLIDESELANSGLDLSSSPGAHSCGLTGSPPNIMGKLEDSCDLQVTPTPKLKKKLRFGIKLKATVGEQAIQVSFCTLDDKTDTCP